MQGQILLKMVIKSTRPFLEYSIGFLQLSAYYHYSLLFRGCFLFTLLLHLLPIKNQQEMITLKETKDQGHLVSRIHLFTQLISYFHLR